MMHAKTVCLVIPIDDEAWPAENNSISIASVPQASLRVGFLIAVRLRLIEVGAVCGMFDLSEPPGNAFPLLTWLSTNRFHVRMVGTC